MTIVIPRRGTMAASRSSVSESLQPTDYVALRKTSSTSHTNETWYEVVWTTEDSDTSNFWTSGKTLTVPAGATGYYVFTFGWTYASAMGGRVMAEIWGASDGSPRFPLGSGEDQGSITGLVECVAGNTLSFAVYQAAGSSVNMTGARVELMKLA